MHTAQISSTLLIGNRASDVINDELVNLYRKSCAAGETGKCYVFLESSPLTHGMKLHFLRTEQPINVSGLLALGMQAAHELSDNDVLELFKQA
jgi:hypothetical protein